MVFPGFDFSSYSIALKNSPPQAQGLLLIVTMYRSTGLKLNGKAEDL